MAIRQNSFLKNIGFILFFTVAMCCFSGSATAGKTIKDECTTFNNESDAKPVCTHIFDPARSDKDVFSEWVEACQSYKIADNRQFCFFHILDMVKSSEKKVICDRYITGVDAIEKCNIIACGYDFMYPDLHQDDAACFWKIRTSTCHDGRKNGRETEIDCGGPDCTSCDIGKMCRVDDDCVPGICASTSADYPLRRCYKKCPEGKISNDTSCGCASYGMPHMWDIHTKDSVAAWNKKYGQGSKQALFCCKGKTAYLPADAQCPQ